MVESCKYTLGDGQKTTKTIIFCEANVKTKCFYTDTSADVRFYVFFEYIFAFAALFSAQKRMKIADFGSKLHVLFGIMGNTSGL
jgi:hypothetical protein